MIEKRSSPLALLSRALMRETTCSGTGRSLGAKYSSQVTSVRGQLSKLITRRRLGMRSDAWPIRSASSARPANATTMPQSLAMCTTSSTVSVA